MKALESEKAVDVAVIVSRWYGGELLGPARFEHIRKVTTEAIRTLQINEMVQQLRICDDRIVELRLQLDSETPPQAAIAYDDMTLIKTERLLLARQKRIQLLEQLIKDAAARPSSASAENDAVN